MAIERKRGQDFFPLRLLLRANFVFLFTKFSSVLQQRAQLLSPLLSSPLLSPPSMVLGAGRASFRGVSGRREDALCAPELF